MDNEGCEDTPAASVNWDVCCVICLHSICQPSRRCEHLYLFWRAICNSPLCMGLAERTNNTWSKRCQNLRDVCKMCSDHSICGELTGALGKMEADIVASNYTSEALYAKICTQVCCSLLKDVGDYVWCYVKRVYKDGEHIFYRKRGSLHPWNNLEIQIPVLNKPLP